MLTTATTRDELYLAAEILEKSARLIESDSTLPGDCINRVHIERILTALHHLCDAHNVDFADITAAAQLSYDEDVEDLNSGRFPVRPLSESETRSIFRFGL